MLLILTLFIFLSRIPFLSPGFGDDPDSWRMVDSARFIARTGQYAVSRKPGYPLVEMVYSLIYRFFGADYIVFNLITALLSSFAVFFFVLALKQLRCANYYLAASALAFTPAVYINSVNSMDYMWALFFLMGSLVLVLRQMPVFAGIMLGLAQGCRLTSAVFVLPFGLLMFIPGVCNWKKTVVFVVSAFFAGMACYIPVMNKYGLEFLTYYDILYPDYKLFFDRIMLNVWGWPGTIGICGGIASVLFYLVKDKRRLIRNRRRSETYENIIWVMIVFIYLFMFIFLPAESGYLIPAIPFLIILSQRILNRIFFPAVCFLVILSSFIPLHNVNLFDASIFYNHKKRIARMDFGTDIIRFARNVGGKSVFVLGSWFPQVREQARRYELNNIMFIYLVDGKRLTIAKKERANIYYLPQVRKVNLKVHKIDLDEEGAIPFFRYNHKK